MEYKKNFKDILIESKGFIVSGLIGFTIGVFLVLGIKNGNIEDFNFDIDSEKQHINISLKGKKNIRIDTLLTQMFADSFMQSSIQSWLVKKDIYSIVNPLLEKRLIKLNPDSDLSESIRRLESDKVGPFLYKGEKILFMQVPNGDIAYGQAYVCVHSKYANQKVSLSIKGNRIEIICFPKFDCLESNNPVIKIRKKDVKILLDGLGNEENKDSVWVRKIN